MKSLIQVAHVATSRGRSYFFGIALFGLLFAAPLQAQVVITTTSPLPGGTINGPYSTTFTATGCTGAVCIWSVASGTLPSGISLSPTGVLGGTPSVSGTFNFTVEGGGVVEIVRAQKAFSLTIAPAISITTASLPATTMNVAYSQTLANTGGTAPYTWSISAGSLPTGLTLAPSTGVISGTPSAAGTFNFTARVTDSAVVTGATTTKALSVVVAPALVITTSSLPGGTTGTAYSHTVVSTGGTAPVTWSLASGTLPTSLSLNSGNGIISGTPTAAGSFAFTIQATDSVGATATSALSIAIALPLSITTASLPTGTAGSSYSATVAAIGGVAPLTWSISAGALPVGLALNSSSGAITGIPTTAGTASFTVRVVDNVGAASTKDLSITIAASLTITTSSLPGGTIGAAYSTTVAASGGTAPRTWSVSAGALPAGVSLNTSTGAITGTPSAAGTANFTIRVTDNVGAAATRDLSITIAGAPAITTTSLPGGTVGSAYAQTVAATGGTAPLTLSISVGSIPAGLSLNTSTGAITGTPSTAGTASFTVRVVDNVGAAATKALSITIAAALTITTPSLPGGTLGLEYSQTATAVGGTSPFVWSISAGALPAGVNLNTSTGAITGTPSAAGTANFTIRVADNVGASATKALSITIASAPTITTSSLPGGTIGASYSQTVVATGGTVPLTWSISAGAVPVGLSLNASSGAITGTPSAAGTASFTVRVVDSFGAVATRDLSIAIAAALTITTSSLPGGTVGTSYSQTAAATGGTLPRTWSVAAGALPAGLSLNSGSGAITGTPTATGTANFTLRVADSVGASATKALSITISSALTITTSSLPGGTVGASYSQTATAAGGTLPFTWSISVGALPAGLSLNASTGAITGTPSTAGTAGFTLHLSDAGGQVANQALSITIASALTITTNSLAGGTVGTAYSQTAAAGGGTPPLTWSVSAGAIPGGLNLNTSTGTISGTPSTAGTASFTLQVSDAVGASTTKALSITIASALTITTSSLAGGTIGASYSQTVAATGGTAPLSWSVSVGSLPAGLSIATGTGVISGTPSAAGTPSFTVRVIDNVGAAATRVFAITIASGLTITTSSFPGSTVGATYSQTAAATGGTAPRTWSISAGALPSGLVLNSSTGAITGAPSVAGTASFTLRVADAAGAAATKALSITIAPALTFTTTSLPGGTVGVAYSQTVVASGGTAPVSWSLVSSTLPAGLSFNTGTGAITGTPSSAGLTNFTVQVADAVGATATRALSITIAPALTITTPSLTGGTLGTAYSQTVVASGGTVPLAWSISTGALPAGLSLNTSTGAITGTPSTAGTSNFTVRVADIAGAAATKALSIAIAATLTITTSTLSGGTAAASYSQTVAATGGTPPLSWSVSAGALPAGLSLNTGTGTIAGTPSTSGTFNFTIRVADTAGAAATKALSITIAPVLTITTSSFPGGTIGAAYSHAAAATGGTLPLTWSVSEGALPTGFSLNPSTGDITGTPTINDASTFRLQVRDDVGAQESQEFSITISAELKLTTTSLPGGTVGAAYSQMARSAGGTLPVTWSVSAGSLPAALSLDASSGAITGTPTTAGLFNFTIQVADSAGANATKALTITIGAALAITTTALPDGTISMAYSSTVIQSGGTAPYVWLITEGSLPAGLSLNAGAGVISGTPTLAGTSGFTIQVLDNAGAVTAVELAIEVTVPLSITTSVLPGGTIGSAYSQAIAASGGGTPYTGWTVIAGALPAGLILNSGTGVISGTPSATETATFTVRVNDAGEPTRTSSKVLSIAVAAPISITTTTLSNGHVGASYSAALVAIGGTSPYSWVVTAGFIPAGLTLNAATGVISGTPTTAGISNFLVQASDNGNPQRKIIQPLSITVVPALIITGTSLQGGIVGSSYSQTVTATGDTPPFTWSISAGSLPAGLTLNIATGEISGLPTTVGLSNFTLQVRDSVMPVPTTASRALSINVEPAPVVVTPVPVITTSTLPPGTVGIQYAQSVGVTGGVLPYILSVVGEGAPPGLTLSSAGTLTGIPSSAGTFDFTVRVTDSAIPAQTAVKSVSIVIISALSITTSSLPPVDAGAPYSITLSAAGGTQPYVWSITGGALPAGITLNSATGVISGTPNTAGTFNIRINVSDADALITFKNFDIVVLFPEIDISIPATSQPAQPMPLGLTLRSPYPSALSGQLILTFTPNAANINDDPMLQFSNGSRTTSFTIAANSTIAVFSPPIQLLTGTVAGTVRMGASFINGPSDLLAGITEIPAAAPQITAVEATLSSSTIVVRVTGYSVTRSVMGVTFGFDVRAASGIQRVNYSRSVDADFGTWYQNPQSAAYGSLFVFSQTLNVQGDASTIEAVVVTLTNVKGSVSSVSTPVVRK